MRGRSAVQSLGQIRAATGKHTMVGQKYLRGTNVRLGGQKYPKCNKTNNNSENFRGKVGARGCFSSPSPLDCGPEINKLGPDFSGTFIVMIVRQKMYRHNVAVIDTAKWLYSMLLRRLIG